MRADSTVTDGLDELQASRLSRQHRRPPAPKRPRTLDRPSAPVTDGATTGPSHGEDPSPATLALRDAADVTDPKSVQADKGPLTLVQIRVTEAQLEYLDEIDALAATRRLDVSDAAVVRLALSQLMAAHTPDQVVEQLGQPKVRGRRGRPRH